MNNIRSNSRVLLPLWAGVDVEDEELSLRIAEAYNDRELIMAAGRAAAALADLVREAGLVHFLQLSIQAAMTGGDAHEVARMHEANLREEIAAFEGEKNVAEARNQARMKPVFPFIWAANDQLSANEAEIHRHRALVDSGAAARLNRSQRLRNAGLSEREVQELALKAVEAESQDAARLEKRIADLKADNAKLRAFLDDRPRYRLATLDGIYLTELARYQAQNVG